MDPKLRDDFPIDWDEDHYVSRREFLKFMTLASGGLAVGSAAMATWTLVPRTSRSFEPLEIVRTRDIAVGEAIHFGYPRATDLCILIQTEPGVYTAYSRRCTHLSCPVEWQAERRRLYCPCHNGAFAPEDGHVLQGPPPRPLPKIQIEVRGESIYAVGVEQGDA